MLLRMWPATSILYFYLCSILFLFSSLDYLCTYYFIHVFTTCPAEPCSKQKLPNITLEKITKSPSSAILWYLSTNKNINFEHSFLIILSTSLHFVVFYISCPPRLDKPLSVVEERPPVHGPSRLETRKNIKIL